MSSFTYFFQPETAFLGIGLSRFPPAFGGAAGCVSIIVVIGALNSVHEQKRATSSSAHCELGVALEPPNRFAYPVLQSIFCPPAEFRKRARCVKTAARLAVGSGGIPAQRALETNQGTNLFRQIANADLFAGAKIHEIRLGILLRSQDDG